MTNELDLPEGYHYDSELDCVVSDETFFYYGGKKVDKLPTTSSGGKKVYYMQNFDNTLPRDECFYKFDISEKMLKKKCKGCGHSISSHYCEIVKGSSDFRGKNITRSKIQHCVTCGAMKCNASTNKDLDILLPILNYRTWEKKK